MVEIGSRAASVAIAACNASPVLQRSGARLLLLPEFVDGRGALAVAEERGMLPFPPHRFFLVYGVPAGQSRGNHAHYRCAQLALAVHGAVTITVDDGLATAEVLLDRPTHALLIPPMVWSHEHSFTGDAVLLVVASHPYDPADYIHDHAAYVRLVQGRR